MTYYKVGIFRVHSLVSFDVDIHVCTLWNPHHKIRSKHIGPESSHVPSVISPWYTSPAPPTPSYHPLSSVTIDHVSFHCGPSWFLVPLPGWQIPVDHSMECPVLGKSPLCPCRVTSLVPLPPCKLEVHAKTLLRLFLLCCCYQA